LDTKSCRRLPSWVSASLICEKQSSKDIMTGR
jgi:hypothetical protein